MPGLVLAIDGAAQAGSVLRRISCMAIVSGGAIIVSSDDALRMPSDKGRKVEIHGCVEVPGPPQLLKLLPL